MCFIFSLRLLSVKKKKQFIPATHPTQSPRGNWTPTVLRWLASFREAWLGFSRRKIWEEGGKLRENRYWLSVSSAHAEGHTQSLVDLMRMWDEIFGLQKAKAMPLTRGQVSLYGEKYHLLGTHGHSAMPSWSPWLTKHTSVVIPPYPGARKYPPTQEGSRQRGQRSQDTRNRRNC